MYVKNTIGFQEAFSGTKPQQKMKLNPAFWSLIFAMF